MGLSCAAYRAQDWFRRTWLASKLFYSGQRYKHGDPISVMGHVEKEFHATDGDICFDVLATDGMWHCEVTPCATAQLKQLAGLLKPGERVIVHGTKTDDPNHHIGPKHFSGGGGYIREVHPVSAITLLDA